MLAVTKRKKDDQQHRHQQQHQLQQQQSFNNAASARSPTPTPPPSKKSSGNCVKSAGISIVMTMADGVNNEELMHDSLDEEDIGFDDGKDEDDEDDDDSMVEILEDEDDDDAADFEDDDGNDNAFQVQGLEKPIVKAYEVESKALSVQDIRERQTEQITQISTMFAVSQADAATLLRYFQWKKEKLIDKYMEMSDQVAEKAGVAIDSDKLEARIKMVPGFLCDICCNDEEGLETFALKCDHRFCKDCYSTYLTQKIKGEGESYRIQCPENNCNMAVDEKSVQLLVEPSIFRLYIDLLDRLYVDDNDHLRWCPAPGCTYALECPISPRQYTSIVPSVTCACGNIFCFGCGLADHRPAVCNIVKLWVKKCADDSETANWMSSHTKECPQCTSTIEKNGGCNHMTCKKCRHEFCWVCMGRWQEHGTSWYNCNRFNASESIGVRDQQSKSRVALERYLHVWFDDI